MTSTLNDVPPESTRCTPQNSPGVDRTPPKGLLVSSHSAVPRHRGALDSGLRLADPALVLVGTGRHHMSPGRFALQQLLHGLKLQEQALAARS